MFTRFCTLQKNGFSPVLLCYGIHIIVAGKRCTCNGSTCSACVRCPGLTILVITIQPLSVYQFCEEAVLRDQFLVLCLKFFDCLFLLWHAVHVSFQ